MERNRTKPIRVGNVVIGGSAPIVVQSMTNTDTKDTDSTKRQIQELAAAGCEIVRLAVVDLESTAALETIKRSSPIPLVADIQFDYKVALAAIDHGADKLRLNPGNIGSEEKVRQVAEKAKTFGIPIRIGVNSGSLPAHVLQQYGRSGEALAVAALEHVRLLESFSFDQIVISLKGTDIAATITAYETISRQVNYPLHIGITEAGTSWFGTIKSAAGIGALLSRGIGDTVRVSLTANPVKEVEVAFAILAAMNLRQRHPVVISCPTCARTEIPLTEIAEEVEKRLQGIDIPLKVAVMGCAVNGPGEAKGADVGIAGGRGVGIIFRAGNAVRKVPQDQLVDALMQEIELIKECTP